MQQKIGVEFVMAMEHHVKLSRMNSVGSKVRKVKAM